MARRLIFPFLAAVLLAGCGDSSPTPTTTTARTTPQVALKVYFYRDNGLVPVVVHVPQTAAVATAAVSALLAGPPAGYRTAIPAGTQLESIAIGSNSGATARTSPALEQLDRTGRGQIVYTLTEFPTITLVNGLPRSAFADLTPEAPIFVGEPARDSTVSSPVHASGTADVFEGTFAVDVWSGGKHLRTQTIQASSGTGTRGTWSATIDLPPGPARLVFYEPSAENGTPLHATTVELTVS